MSWKEFYERIKPFNGGTTDEGRIFWVFKNKTFYDGHKDFVYKIDKFDINNNRFIISGRYWGYVSVTPQKTIMGNLTEW